MKKNGFLLMSRASSSPVSEDYPLPVQFSLWRDFLEASKNFTVGKYLECWEQQRLLYAFQWHSDKKGYYYWSELRYCLRVLNEEDIKIFKSWRKQVGIDT